MPDISYELKSFIKIYGLEEELDIYSFNNELIPIDNDIITLNMPNAFRDIYMYNDKNILTVISKVLCKLELIYGLIQYKFIKGDNSKIVNDLLETEESINLFNKKNYGIHSCIILERAVDFISPFCRNYTYEGLLDEYFGIKWNNIKVKNSLLDKSSSKRDNKVSSKQEYSFFELSSNNILYEKCRNMLLWQAAQYIQTCASEIKNLKDKTKDETTNISAVAENLKKMKDAIKSDIPFLEKHIPLLEYISKDIKSPNNNQLKKYEQLLIVGDMSETLHEFYEDQIGKKLDLYQILRLMCLESLTHNGIVDYNKIKKDILLFYGFEKIFIFHNLEKAGLLKEKGIIGNPLTNIDYSSLFFKMELLNTDINFNDIKDCSYIYEGYCSISLKLIEKAVSGTWGKIADCLNKIPGFTKFPENASQFLKDKKPDKNFVFVVFIGGVTYAEIEGIRFLNKTMNDTKIIIVTTHIISPKNLFDSSNKNAVNDNFTIKLFNETILKDENKLRNKK